MKSIKELVQMGKNLDRMTQEADIALKQFIVAAQSDDKEKMEAARLSIHTITDARLDMVLEIALEKEKALQDILKRFGK